MIDRFMAKVMPIPEAGCWIWTAARMPNGYGIFRRSSGSRLAHRVSYELFKGHVPDELKVLHHCDVRCCVNPDHLFIGTHADNFQDMVSKDRQFWEKDRCRNGHLRTEENTRIVYGKWKQCRICDRQREFRKTPEYLAHQAAYSAAYRARLKAEK